MVVFFGLSVLQAVDEVDDPDGAICWLCKRTLESLQEKVKKGEDITKEDVIELTSPAELADDEIMVPVDMRGVEEVFQSVAEMVVS